MRTSSYVSGRYGLIGWLVAYVITCCGVAAVLITNRQPLIERFSQPELAQDWDRWREHVAEERTTESVHARKVPRSPQSPALVLLRDHFERTLFIAWGLWTGLFTMLAVGIHGTLFGRSQPVGLAEHDAERSGNEE